MSTWLRKTVALSTVRSIVVLSLAFTQVPHSYAQTPAQPGAQAKVAAQPSLGLFDHSAGTSSSKPADPASAADNQQLPPAVANALAAMQARIDQLEAELKSKNAHEPAPSTASLVGMKTTSAPGGATPAALPTPTQEAAPSAQPEAKPEKAVPFAYADWTWLNGTSRNKDAVWDSKFFTPEIRFDTHFVHSFNHPKDDTLGGSTEIFRSNEFQVEQISFGGDFHWQNVRGRVLTMNGMFATTTPRNDASSGRGQWALRGAYRYVSEAYGGYHFDVNHGLNVDAGIFVSYIGLFSYYNFDNWAYQPSYVSSNTPWFFNGIRLQWFPTDKLKIEPWIINGWQSYGRMGSKPGLGGQILWRPKPWLAFVFNNYGMGEDTLGNGQANIHRSRIHTDDSVLVKYYDRPQKFLDKAAFSFTADAGCEYGGGVSCHGNGPGGPKQSFVGWMAYNRFWFKKDTYGLTVGGGMMNNPGRYLVLMPPINGADAISGSPYFTANPGDPYKGWDALVTFDWMPKQYITFRTEYGYRHANVPYFTGPNGITPPGGNTGSPSIFAGTNTGSPGQFVGTASLVPGGPFLSATPGFTCDPGAAGWCPDLRKNEASLRFAILVKF